jgi:hypothetical protein
VRIPDTIIKTNIIATAWMKALVLICAPDFCSTIEDPPSFAAVWFGRKYKL